MAALLAISRNLHILAWVMLVNPCELNMIIAALTNHFYTTLTQEQFRCLTIFLNELSKSMFATILFKDICHTEHKEELEAEKKKEA